MKKILLISLIILGTYNIVAQSPQKISFQATVRDSGGTLIQTNLVGIRISILQGTVSGTVVFSEAHTTYTNINGLVSLEIGSGTTISGSFSAIDWANGPYFIKTEVDPAGGTSYNISGTIQFLSVPYALHAKTVEIVNYTETDPVFGMHPASGITPLNISQWNESYGWGNHTATNIGSGIARVFKDEVSHQFLFKTIKEGAGISVTNNAEDITISNISPDRIITLAGSGINTITGTYPDFTITGTEVDGSASNELQSLNYSPSTGILGITSGNEITLPMFSTTGINPGFVNGSNNAGGSYYLNGNGGWSVPPDNNTNYSAGYGLTLNGTQFNNARYWKDQDTLKTSLNGIVKASSGVLSWVPDNSAYWDIGYIQRLSSASGTSPLTLTLTSNSLTGSITQASWMTNGYLSAADWTMFYNKQNALTIGSVTSGSSRISLGGTPSNAIIGSGFSIDVNQSNIDHNALLNFVAQKHFYQKSIDTVNTSLSGLVNASSGVLSAITDNSANWNTAFGWGDHTLSNVGTGQGGIYRDKTGAQINLKTLKQGSGITVTNNADDITITNSSPDQAIAITGAGINAVTGTYPNFTITGTEADGSTSNELQNLSYTPATGALGISSGSGITLPAFATTSNNPGLVAGSNNAGAAYFLNGSGAWSVPPDNNTTYSAGFGLALNGTTFGNSRYWKGQDTLKTSLTGLVKASSGVLSAITDNSANWNTAFGWGDHTLSNVGTGQGGIYRDKTGAQINLKTLMQGSGITVTNNADDITITNSSPDQVVSIGNGTAISVTGSYPSFTIANTLPDQTVALTNGGNIGISGTYPNFTLTNSAPDQTVVINGAGINAVTGTYPNFTITGTEADGSTSNELQNLSYTPATGALGISSGSGITLPAFATTSTNPGLVAGSNNAGAAYFLNGSGAWSVPPDNNTTYSAGFGMALNGTTFGNSRYWKGQDTLKTTLTGLVKASSGVLSAITDNSANWNTAFGWGDHTLSNVGTGQGGIYRDKTGAQINLKTLKQGTGITVANNADDITITNSSPDQVVSIGNGTAISVTGAYPSFTIANTLPDQTVALTNGGNIGISGTYPNFTLTNSAPDQTVTLTNGGSIGISGTYPNFTLTNSAPDQTVAITGAGINAVSGTYPNFTITGTEADGSTSNELQNLSYTPATGALGISSGSGITLPAFATTSINPGLVAGSNNAGATYFLNGSGAWSVPPDNNTTYSAGFGMALNGTTFGNSRYWEDQDTLKKTLTGLVKASSGALSAITDNSANWDAGYTFRLTSASGTAPLTLSLASNGLTGSVSQANGSTNGFLSSTDWTTFNAKLAAADTANNIRKNIIDAAGDLVVGTANNSYARLALGSDRKYIRSDGSTLLWDTIANAAAASRGLLTSTDWNTFNNKQNTITAQNVSAASSKISLGGNPTGSTLQAFSIDVNQNNIDHNALLNFVTQKHFYQKSIDTVNTSLTGLIKANAGLISSITDNSGYWNSAYGWGDHTVANAGTGEGNVYKNKTGAQINLKTIKQGTGITVTNNNDDVTIANSSPDQTVSITNGGNIAITGTYPNFTLTNSAPDQTVSIIGTGINSVTGTYPNFTITGTEADGSTTNELQNLSYSTSTGNLAISSGTGITLPVFATTSTNPGLVNGSNNAGTSYYLNGNGAWTVPPDNNTTYSAGYGLVLNGTLFGNTKYWKDQDTLKSSLSGLVKATSGVLTAISDNSSNWDAGYSYRLTSASGTAPLSLSLASNGLTAGWNAQTASTVFAGPSSGSAAIPTFRGLVADDIPVLDWSKITTGKPTTLLGYDITDALNLAGGTLTGKLNTAASSSSWAGLKLPHGEAPGSPVNGDLWTTTAGVYARINGSTVGPFGIGNGTVTSVTGTTDRITSSGGITPAIDIAATYVGQTSITTLGTIGTGTWNATAIADGKIASALTGKTYNGLTLSAQDNGFTLAGGTTPKTLTVPLDASVSGTNTGDETQATIKTKLGAVSSSTDGYLTSTDWSTFNNKQGALGYTAENSANKVMSFQTTPDNTHYPSEKLVSDQLALKVNANSAITGATKTKITYDSKGLVTAGSDATTADIAASTNKNYVTDAQLTVIGNTSGTNTGDITLASNHGLSLTNQVLALGTPSSVTGGSSNSVTTTTHTHALSAITNNNLSGTAGITNANLANSSVTIGSTTVSLGATSTSLAGKTDGTSAISGFSANITDTTTTSITLKAYHNGKIILLNNGSSIIATINTGLPTGFNCMIVQKGAGQITFSGSATIKNRSNYTKTAGQYAIATIVSIGGDIIVTSGDMQ